MIHFASTLNSKTASNAQLPRRIENLNATQSVSPTHKIFLTVEEELHDARRVQSDGQEEDLKLALNMLIARLSEVSSMLSEAYKIQADLEVQLNVAKSNLQLVISNNEMLEEALKRDGVGNPKDVGWHRPSARESREITERRNTMPSESEQEHNGNNQVSTSPQTTTKIVDSPQLSSQTVSSPTGTGQEPGRFFRFRFPGTGGGSGMISSPATRPGTPQLNDPRSPNPNQHMNSPLFPALPMNGVSREKEIEEELLLEKEKRKQVEKEKAALEAELESLSQALFEEANKMVATERMKCADTEEELREAQREKEALRSALRLLESENEQLKGSTGGSYTSSPEISSLHAAISTTFPTSASEPSLSLPSSSNFATSISAFQKMHRRRTSSQVGMKSVPGSPLPASSSSPNLVSTESTIAIPFPTMLTVPKYDTLSSLPQDPVLDEDQHGGELASLDEATVFPQTPPLPLELNGPPIPVQFPEEFAGSPWAGVSSSTTEG